MKANKQIKTSVLIITMCLVIRGFSQTPGAALLFDGVNDWVIVNHNAAFNITSAITLEAWVLTTNAANRYITTKGDDSWYLAINGPAAPGNNGKLTVFFNGLGAGWITGTTTVNDATWHHVAATYDGSNIKLYVDGNLDKVQSATGSISTGTSAVEFGHRLINQLNVSYYAGVMDEIRIWNVARTQCQIQAYMKCEIPGAAAGLVANYHFNQGIAGANNTSITSVTDDSGNNLNGSLINFNLNPGGTFFTAPGGVASGSTTPLSNTVTASGSSPFICKGETLSLSASGATSYSWSSGANSQNTTVNPTTTSVYTVTGNNNGCVSQATVSINVNECTGLQKEIQDGLIIYPNPASGKITVTGISTGTIFIRTLLGAIILEKLVIESADLQLDLSEFVQGTYFVEVKNERGFYRSKLIKN